MDDSLDELADRYFTSAGFRLVAELVDGSSISRDASIYVFQWEKLDESIDQLLERRPESSILWFWRGYSYYFLGPGSTGAIALWEALARYEQIEASFDRAIELKPDNAAAVLFLCHLYWHEARRKRMIRDLPTHGFESAEALSARIEAEGSEPYDHIVETFYPPFDDDVEPDFSAARQVWSDNCQNLELQWDAIPFWFTYDSEFDGETRLALSDYAGWVGILEDMGVDVFGEVDAAWIVGAAVCSALGQSRLELGERIRLLEWALETGITEPTYRYLCQLHLTAAKLERPQEGQRIDRNAHFELTEYEEIVGYFESTNDVDKNEYNNLHMIRRDYAGFLNDWLDNTPEIQTEPAVSRLVERSLHHVLTGEFGESDGAFRLWHFLGQQQAENHELQRAEETLRKSFDHLKTEAIAFDLASVLRDLDREDDAIEILKMVRSPSRVLRQYLKQLGILRDERRSPTRRAEAGAASEQLLSELLAFREESRNKSGLILEYVQETTKHFDETSARLEQRMESISNAPDPEIVAEAVSRQVTLQTRWIGEFVVSLGKDLSFAPAWFREDVISAESIFDTLCKRDKADFGVAILLWGILAEKALQEGLLTPFGRWLDEREYSDGIPEGKSSKGQLLFPSSGPSQGRRSTWTHCFGTYARCDQLLIAVIEDKTHPFAEFIRANKGNVVAGPWLKREELPAKLTKVRVNRNDAAHPERRKERGPFTLKDAEEIHSLMWKSNLLRDLCRLLAGAEAD